MKTRLYGVLLAGCVMATHAHDGPHTTSSATSSAASSAKAATVRVGQSWDFTLPSLDGSRFVRASEISGPVLVNFWGRDCPPCVAELPRLHAFAQANPRWTVLLVSTDSPAVAREFVQRHNLTLPVLRPGGNVTALMRSAGNRSSSLPFTVALQNAHICESQTGTVEATDLERMAQSCKQL